VDPSTPRRWLPAVLVVGALYCLAGLGFGTLANHALSQQGRVIWRLAAWVISAVAFAAHVWHEHRRLQSVPPLAAFHTALAVALGAFGLAVGATLHSLTTSSPRHFPALMLLVWPLITAVPAFVVALAAAAALARLGHPTGDQSR
jgi:hypothetical protein